MFESNMVTIWKNGLLLFNLVDSINSIDSDCRFHKDFTNNMIQNNNIIK